MGVVSLRWKVVSVVAAVVIAGLVAFIFLIPTGAVWKVCNDEGCAGVEIHRLYADGDTKVFPLQSVSVIIKDPQEGKAITEDRMVVWVRPTSNFFTQFSIEQETVGRVTVASIDETTFPETEYMSKSPTVQTLFVDKRSDIISLTVNYTALENWLIDKIIDEYGRYVIRWKGVVAFIGTIPGDPSAVKVVLTLPSLDIQVDWEPADIGGEGGIEPGDPVVGSHDITFDVTGASGDVVGFRYTVKTSSGTVVQSGTVTNEPFTVPLEDGTYSILVIAWEESGACQVFDGTVTFTVSDGDDTIQVPVEEAFRGCP